MNSLLVLVALIGCSQAFFQADTPEVAHARRQFFDTFNAVAASRPVSEEYVYADDNTPADLNDGLTYPAAEPYEHIEPEAERYVHVEIPALPYIHEEPPRRRKQRPSSNNVYADSDVYADNNVFAEQPARPAASYSEQLAAHAKVQQLYAQQLNYVNNPQPLQQGFVNKVWRGTCYNTRGEGVPCRNNHA